MLSRALAHPKTPHVSYSLSEAARPIPGGHFGARRQLIDDQVAQMSDISHCDMQQQIVDPADVKHLENLGEPANVRIEGTELYSGMSSEPDCDDRLTCITNHRTGEEDVKLLVSEVMRMLR